MFVYRNYTVENLFPDARFSGYGDISYIPVDERELVWCYQAPIGFDVAKKAEQIRAYVDSLRLMAASMRPEQNMIVCSLVDVFPLQIVGDDLRISEAMDFFNAEARSMAAANSQIKFLDLIPYFRRFPRAEVINWKFYFISQMIVSPAVASGFYSWFCERKSQLEGKRKKCIVLDLDNTLWGGVLGEDGVEGIKIGGDYPGNVFLYFQNALIELSKTGVILTLCSKNNEADVEEAWRRNPFIKLNSEYISAKRINWNNKADNIRELAKELNIGLDSMVFVDDNPSERELVRQELPMVAVPEFPKRPYMLMQFFKELVDTYFLTPSLTEEDRKKTEQYKANALRAGEAGKFADLESFIKSLEITVSLMDADDVNIPRIAQMTQKTNQFNLTTRRYEEGDIKRFVNEGYLVVCAAVADRFGDNGITAVAAVKVEGRSAHIDSYLLSCRILGKGIEKAILSAVLNRLFSLGVRSVTAEYIPTAKNGQVADFYATNGFSLSEQTADGIKNYIKELTGPTPIAPAYKFT